MFQAPPRSDFLGVDLVWQAGWQEHEETGWDMEGGPEARGPGAAVLCCGQVLPTARCLAPALDTQRSV